jgi:putative transposase
VGRSQKDHRVALLFGWGDLPGPRRPGGPRLPHGDADMMQLHVDEISRNVAEGAHAVLLLDRAGWHTTNKLDLPDNITPISCRRVPRS